MSKRNRRNKIGRNDPCWCGSGEAQELPHRP
ncbi:MAG: SEC-C domain-containing protein [Anaerolineales bacterium]|nr:SEC-C domain-containing protein [Anaerolineales bacterium]